MTANDLQRKRRTHIINMPDFVLKYLLQYEMLWWSPKALQNAFNTLIISEQVYYLQVLKYIYKHKSTNKPKS